MCYQWFLAELIDKFITIDTKFLNKFLWPYIKALFINHCDVIHSIFIRPYQCAWLNCFVSPLNRNELFILLEIYEQENVRAIVRTIDLQAENMNKQRKLPEKD